MKNFFYYAKRCIRKINPYFQLKVCKNRLREAREENQWLHDELGHYENKPKRKTIILK